MKCRRKITTKNLSRCLKSILQEVRRLRPEVDFKEIGRDKDHVYLHVIIPPRHAVSEVVRDIKWNTSRWLKEPPSKSTLIFG